MEYIGIVLVGFLLWSFLVLVGGGFVGLVFSCLCISVYRGGCVFLYWGLIVFGDFDIFILFFILGMKRLILIVRIFISFKLVEFEFVNVYFT